MAPWAAGRIILASASPRRLELLRLAGLDPETMPSGADEALRPGETVRDHVLRLAEAKAQAVSARHPEAWVLGADTIVVIAGEILGKPGSFPEAKRMLQRLSGRAHEVLTGFCILRPAGGVRLGEVVASQVRFRTMTDGEMAWYAGLPEPYDKAGGYAAQGVAACFIREIRGSYTNVVGLPLCEVVAALQRLGAIGFAGGGDDGGR
jgi:septum formation protein